jgi:hypothetical protein
LVPFRDVGIHVEGVLTARYEMPTAEQSSNMHPSENKFMAFLMTLDLRIRAQPCAVLCC